MMDSVSGRTTYRPPVSLRITHYALEPQGGNAYMAVTTAQSKEARRAPLPLTSRRDNWWIKPLITVIVLGGFVIYTTWRGLQNNYYEWGPYLSPFYSPLLHFNLTLFGWNVSPAVYIVAFPLAF